jgi:hypothetical protein
MFAYPHDFTPDVEISSIDEGYFDLSEPLMIRTFLTGLAVPLVKGGQPTNVTKTFSVLALWRIIALISPQNQSGSTFAVPT